MASTSGGTVVWELDADSSKLNQGLSDAQSSVKKTAGEVQTSMGGIKNSVMSAGSAFKALADSAVAGSAVITGSLGLIAKSAIDMGASYQSARTSFETFLGSGEKAGKLLGQLGEFAAKTPFDMPQVVEGSQKLLAFGVTAEEIIPTFRMLGDLSGGSADKLGQLTRAFGQVRAATVLQGDELNQFTEAGIPLLDALAEEFNKNGGAMKQVGKAVKATNVNVGELNDKLAIARKRLEETTAKGKAKESTMMSLRNQVQNYEQAIAKATETNKGTAASFTKVKLTARDMKEMISEGEVTFEHVQSALQRMTGEGGRFFKNMENQSKTFSGVMSNVGDEIKRFTLEALGFFIAGDQAGTVREGSIFHSLQIGAEGLLGALQRLRPVATAFVDSFLKNQGAMTAALGALIGLMVPLGLAFASLLAPALLFAAAGAVIFTVVNQVVQAMGGWKPVMDTISNAFTVMGDIFNRFILPSLREIGVMISTELMPQLQRLWELISPILIPALKVLGAGFGILLVGGMRLGLEMLELFIDGITRMVSIVRWGGEVIKEIFWNIPMSIKASMSGVESTIKSPFEGAYKAVADIADKIKAKMDQISPFHRNSPSLIDKVQSGVAIIKDEFSSLKGLSFPSVAASIPTVSNPMTQGDAPGRSQQQYSLPGKSSGITIKIDKVDARNEQDIEKMGREVAFRAAILPTS